MRLVVVSDLHIWNAEDPLYARLLSLVGGLGPDDTLVLGGDIFDLFVANKRVFKDPYQELWNALSEKGRIGTQIFYIEGNHDFHLKGALAKIPGLQVTAGDVRVQLKGKRFLFAHGDLANSSDYSYRALRLLFRSPVVKLVATLVPGKFVKRIGTRLSKYSRGRKPTLPSDLEPERLESLRKVYRNYAATRALEGFDFIVMGHCHDLDEKEFLIDGRHVQYVNVGFPRVHGSYLEWTPADEKIRRAGF